MNFDTDTVIKIAGAVGGALGSVLGLYNFFHARRKEADDRLNQENDLSMLAAMLEAQNQKDGVVFQPNIGSDEWKRAERLVGKGIIVRGPSGRGYCLPGTFEP